MESQTKTRITTKRPRKNYEMKTYQGGYVNESWGTETNMNGSPNSTMHCSANIHQPKQRRFQRCTVQSVISISGPWLKCSVHLEPLSELDYINSNRGEPLICFWGMTY